MLAEPLLGVANDGPEYRDVLVDKSPHVEVVPVVDYLSRIAPVVEEEQIPFRSISPPVPEFPVSSVLRLADKAVEEEV